MSLAFRAHHGSVDDEALTSLLEHINLEPPTLQSYASTDHIR